MRIVRPYGESVAPGAGHARLLRLKLPLHKTLGDPPERPIPPFAESHDELVIAQWISTIDKIATKPKGQSKPTPAQRALRDKLGQAAWQLLVEQALLPGLPTDSDDDLRKLWWFKIHPYPKGEAKPRYVKGREVPDPRGRWYRRFIGDDAPGAIDAAAIAARIHEHLHVAEYRHGTDQKREGGRIARRALSIEKNVASLAQVTRTSPTWTQADVEQYRQTAGDVAAAIKAAAEAREEKHWRVGADTAAEVLHPAFGRVFSGKGIEAAQAEAPGLAALHLAIRDFYQRRLKRHGKNKKEHGNRRRPVSATLPATLDGLLAMLGHAAANRDVAALVRLGKVLHYEAAARQVARLAKEARERGKPAPASDGDAPAHVLTDWPADVADSVYWSSARQAEIKRNEAFVRIWRHSLALAAQTLRDWASPDGSFPDDILLADGIRDLPKGLDLDHHAGKLAVLLGNRAELLLKGREDDFQRATLKLALEGLAQLRHNSFHFNGLGGFAEALQFTRKPEITADQDLWGALEDLWQEDLKERGKRLVKTLKAAHLHHFFDWPSNKRLLNAVAKAKLAESADDLPLPRFRRLLDRAANISGEKGFELRLPQPVNRQQIEDSPAIHAQYVGLKLLYEHPFRQWVAGLDTASLNAMIEKAKDRADAAAKGIFGKDDADRRQVVTAKVKSLAGLADGEKLRSFYFRLSRETAAEMRVQRGYESDAEQARKQAAFIEELLIDVLAQAFARYLEEKKFGFLVELGADERKPEKKCDLLRPVIEGDAMAAPQWQLLLYFLMHLIPVDDVGRLLHQIRKWDIVAGKAAGTQGSGDADVDRLVRTLTLYLDMHDAKFTGHQALRVLEPFESLYTSPETFDRVFPAKGAEDDERLPRRGLREIMRFGHLPPLQHVFDAHKVADTTVDDVEEAEAGPVAAAQHERERLHGKWVDEKRKLGARDLEDYVEALAEVTRHRHAAADVRLVNHVKLHRLMLAVLGRLLDFAGLFERDLYFAMLALLYREGRSPQQALSEHGIEMLEDGRVIEVRRDLNKNDTVERDLLTLFGPRSGRIVQVRNNLAHFNMLNLKRSRGATIDLTAQVNAARRLMAYDRKLKNAVAQSVIELVAREGLQLRWEVAAQAGEHDLIGVEITGRQATHLDKLRLYEEVGNEKKDRWYPLTESLHGHHLVEMAAALFGGTAIAPKDRDVTSLPTNRIDWQRSVAGKQKNARNEAHPNRPSRRGDRAHSAAAPS